MITNAIDIRRRNTESIRKVIQQRTACTKADIAQETELSAATCSTVLKEMLERREVVQVDQIDSGIGRPSGLFAYKPDFLHALCICIYSQADVCRLDAVLSDALGHIITRLQPPEGTISSTSILQLVDLALRQDPLVSIVSVGIPGVVVDGTVESCSVKSLENINLKSIIEARFPVDALVKNDTTAATYYLYHQHPGITGNFAAIYFPNSADNTCVGSSFVVNGRILQGNSMLSGEISYVAAAFGMSYDAQAQALQNSTDFQKYAAQILMVICCTINPSHVIIMGNGIRPEDLPPIRAYCSALIPERHLPIIQIESDFSNSYTNGLIRYALDSELFPLSL